MGEQAAVVPVVEGGANGINPVVLRQKGPSRESMLAEMGKLDDSKPAMKISTSAGELAEQRQGARAAVDADADADADAETDASDTTVEDAESTDEADNVDTQVDLKPEPTKPDRDTEKRIGLVRKQEARAKAEIAKAKADADERVRTAETKLKEIEARERKIVDLAKRAKSNPWALLQELGLTEDDAEFASRDIYATTKAAAADPKNRAAVEAARKARDSETRTEALEREVHEMRAQLVQRDSQAQMERNVNTFLDSVTKSVSDEHPLIRTLLAKNPGKARNQLHAIAAELATEFDETPDPEDVLVEYEKRRRAELEELGIDPALIGKATPAPVAAAVNGKTRTLGAGGSQTAVKRKPNPLEQRADIVRAMEEDKLEF